VTHYRRPPRTTAPFSDASEAHADTPIGPTTRADDRPVRQPDRGGRSYLRRVMPKAPTREPVREAPTPKLKNYITPAGLERLKDEHRFLLNRERPAVTEVVKWAAGNGDRSENADYLYGKRRLRQIDSRIRFLTKRIDAAEVVDPAAPRPRAAATRVFFGATVTYKDRAGLEHIVSIVGIDEVDLNRRHISWRSPLAVALMKSSPGDRVLLRAPTKTEHLEVLDVEYLPIPMDPFREPPGAEAAARE
jgi:transcription elongation factor GreB